MYIYSDSLDFECPNCTLEGAADCSADFVARHCNGHSEYFIICPNCHNEIRVEKKDIPSNIVPYIKVRLDGGIMSYHD